MKDYKIEEALDLLIRGYSANKQGYLTLEDQHMIAQLESDILELKHKVDREYQRGYAKGLEDGYNDCLK